jgi:hypothetical protein
MKNKKIVICSSISFEREIEEWKNKLEHMGFDVIKYPVKLREGTGAGYSEEFTGHYASIAESDAIIILNIEKKGIPGYIGPGVFAEMSFALGLNKVMKKSIDIYYVNPIPEGLPYSEELGLWQELGWIERI